ncbi:hypothetical protein ACFWYA_22910 [Streptomyces sp. NPDC059011]|uniref:hypothetical protein n=1 Tax=unclassified Streptomyces TaxID=2593676 RepID=UPI0036CEF854
MEASAEEGTTGRATAGPQEDAAGEPAEDAVEVKESVEASADEAAGSVGPAKGADDGAAATGAVSGAEEATAASGAADGSAPSDGSSGTEHVEIPKQQSVDEAADNGAGKGARK